MEQNNNRLNDRQQEAVDHGNGPILIAAGAGSGKTKTLTTRLMKIIERGVNPANIIAITFTNKAANEMRNRIENLKLKIENLFIGTFHSLGVRILKEEAKLLGRNAYFTIYDNDDSLSLIRQILKQLDISKEAANPIKLQNKFSSIKNELIAPKEYLEPQLIHLFNKYEQALRENNAFDFDDLIEKPVRLFEDHPEILTKYQNRFQQVLVDEYQDINTSQYRLIRLLAEKHQNISVVGDDAQSIYRFRGSDFRNFLNFEQDWPKAKIVKLEQNYRSTANIINAASALIKKNSMQTPKTLWTDNEAGDPIWVVKAYDADEEARYVARNILTMTNNNDNKKQGLVIGHSHGHSETTAILYRTNAQSRAIEQSLIMNQIPYKIFGGLRFYQRKEVKDILAGLRVASNPKDSVSIDRLEKTFPKKITGELIGELQRLGEKLSILELINYFLENTNYFDHLGKKFDNVKERTENINELIVFAGTFKSLPEFLERVLLLQANDMPANESLNANRYTLNPVHLMSIHLSKGLEFDQVYVMGCNEGLLPHQMSYGSLDEIEEERRLMYVAMTRARKRLCLTFTHIPSRFVYEIPPELTEFADLSGNKNNLPNEEDSYIEDTW
ncbi:MAG: DNA helicase II / ATP-dependent DNA helicase PcrA [Parcubacteria group bacterium Gr01-1014_3]|nr:MAG: DNA helicase II / ATP-dependent DNA helicase PcrA [Parcubacteria group bacterium Gr01-1014_3]